MFDIFGIPSTLLFGQVLIGLINGSFYALLSLGVAIIFGMLRIGNFVHGSQYMLGAFCAWFLLNLPTLLPGLGLPAINYWGALIIAPIVVGLVGVVIERLFIQRLYDLDHAYGLLLTVGLSMVIEGVFNVRYGAAGQSYGIPEGLQGGRNLGFMFLPNYRIWVIAVAAVVCFGTWLIIERTRLGSTLRAATENQMLVRTFGINVPLLLTLTYGFGVGLAGFAGVLAAPIYQVSPQMGQNIIVTIFAVVVIGGMGSIFGAIFSGLMLGVLEGLTKVFYAPASATTIFIVMAIVLLARPDGLFGRPSGQGHGVANVVTATDSGLFANGKLWLVVLAILGAVAPMLVFPYFAMKIMCFALFACAYNLVFGYVGLLSFGHAAFFGAAAYVTAQAAKIWGFDPEAAILIGTATAAVIGCFFGWLAIRRQGLYFAMITLALAQIVYFYAVQAGWTHGDDGIQSIPRGHLFGFIDLNNTTALYAFVLVLFLGGFAVVHRAIHSPFGQVLKSIRDNEPRAISLGYDTDRFKLLAFVLSAALAGLAGSMQVIVFQLATLNDVYFTTSAEVLLITLIGGVGTVLGPVVGAIILVTLENQFAEFGAWVLVIQGTIFVLCVMFLRKGVVGTFADLLRRRAPSRPPSPDLGVPAVAHEPLVSEP